MDDNTRPPRLDDAPEGQQQRPKRSRKRNAKVAMNFKVAFEFRHLYKVYAAQHDLSLYELFVAGFESHRRETLRLAAPVENEIKK